MSKVQQSAGGGGKVTIEGLAQNTIKYGTTITISQDGKVIYSATGTYK